MSDKWWKTYEWGQIDGGPRLHGVLRASNFTACGLRAHGHHWDSWAILPRCKTCERVIAATAKRYEGEAMSAAKAKGGT